MEKDEFDELLDDVEKNFFSTGEPSLSISPDKNGKKELIESNKSSTIDEMMDALLNEDYDEVVPANRPNQYKPREEVMTVLKDSAANTRCFPVFLGGSHLAMGLSNRSEHKACNKLRCVSCDFHVIWFNDYEWDDSCNYYFLRNNVPNYNKLQEKMIYKQGYRSYACQCSWESVNEATPLPKRIKWVCTKH